MPALHTFTTHPATHPTRIHWRRIITLALNALFWVAWAAAVAILMGLL